MHLGKRMTAAVCAATAFVAFAPSAGASAEAAMVDVDEVIAYDFSAGEWPEGLENDDRGMIYTSLVAGTLHRIELAADGTVDRVVELAKLDVKGGYLLGLAIPETGRILAAVMSPDPSVSGVYEFVEHGDRAEVGDPIALLPAYPNGFPNAIATDDAGGIYVSDSLAGVVYRVHRHGTVERWASGPLFEGDPEGGLENAVYGANGLVVHNGSLYVANTEKSSVVQVPIRPRGQAGTPAVYVEDEQLFAADDIAFDVRGNLYVTASATADRLVRVSADATQVLTLADAEDGLDYPAGMAFGRGPLANDVVYMANVGLDFQTPSILAADVNIPGLPG